MDLTNNSVQLAAITVGKQPESGTINPNGTQVFVSNNGAGTVSVIDTATDTVISTITVGQNPAGVAFNLKGSKAYVANSGDNSISVIDTSTLSVTATDSAGTPETSSNSFTMTINPGVLPTVTAVSPTNGLVLGGDTVTITGTGFTAATAVNFGGTAATNFTVDFDTQITATVPAASVGTVDITVTTANGTSSTSSADEYTYDALYINADRTIVSSGESVTFTTNARASQFAALFVNGVCMDSSPTSSTTMGSLPWSFIGNSITSDTTSTMRLCDSGTTDPDSNTPYLAEVNVVFKALTSTSTEVTVNNVDSLDDITVANGTDESDIVLPETVDVTLSDSTTTSAAVSWDNVSPEYDGDVARTYTFTGTLTLPDEVTNPENYRASVNVIVQAADDESLPPTDDNETLPENNDETPAAVTIEGTKRVGQTLTAQLKDEYGNNYTTSAAVTYEWYRLDDSDSEFSNEIGTGKTYRLTKKDLKKYIGVRVTCGEYSFEYIIGRILRSSSSSSTADTSTNTDTNKNDNKTGWTEDTNDTKYYPLMLVELWLATQ